MRIILFHAVLLGTLHSHAQVTSQTIYFVQPDGRSYLVQRTLRTAASSHRFYLDKRVRREELRHVEPKDFTWDDSSREDVNILSFDSSGFTLVFPGRFEAAQLQQMADGELVYRSWDGRMDADGRFGIWYAPDDFDRFSYSWIFPDNIELISYQSNRDGDWVRRANAVSFYAKDVNNLTFELHYRLKNDPTVSEPIATAAPSAAALPAFPAGRGIGGCDQDCDGDGVRNANDTCPDTAAGAVVDASGCLHDGQRDSDRDGVLDVRDLCPGTQRGARTDRAGCSMDTDKDGVPDGVDRCIATPEGRRVDASGCTAAAAAPPD